MTPEEITQLIQTEIAKSNVGRQYNISQPPFHIHNKSDGTPKLTPAQSFNGFPVITVADASVAPTITQYPYGFHIYQVDNKSSTPHYWLWSYLLDVKTNALVWEGMQFGGSVSAITSINGDTTAAQIISGTAPISASTSSGTTTISSTSSYLLATVPSTPSTGGTTNETTIISFTLPANTLGTSRVVAIDFPFIATPTTSSNITLTYKIYFGGSVVLTEVVTYEAGAAGNANMFGISQTKIIANGATNAQYISFTAVSQIGTTYTGNVLGGGTNYASTTVDTTSNQTVQITMTSGSTVSSAQVFGVTAMLL